MTGLHSKKITCDGSAHTLASQLGEIQAKQFQFLAATANSAEVLIGGSDVASEGFPLIAGSGYETPPNTAETFEFYDALKINYDGANGDILYVLWPVG